MIDSLIDASGVFLRMIFALGATAVLVALLLRLTRSQSYKAHRIAWACVLVPCVLVQGVLVQGVLVQGVLIIQWSLDIPWLTPDEDPTFAAAVGLDLPDLTKLLATDVSEHFARH
jgi:hypothetical protein